MLADLSTGDEARDIVSRILNDTELVQCSYYFKHYLHTAVNKVGLGDRYVDLLSGWQDMLDRGLTTFAEQADPTRSDCHAWSASPNFEIFRTIVGIDSSSFGFKIVTIRPFPGKLGKVSGAIPHPKGEISVKYEVKNSGISAEVVLPPGVTGTFQWKGEASKLNSGRNALKLGQ